MWKTSVLARETPIRHSGANGLDQMLCCGRFLVFLVSSDKTACLIILVIRIFSYKMADSSYLVDL